MTIETRLAILEHRQTIWQTIIRYARGIDEDRPEELEAIFTDDAVSQTKPWSRLLEGKALVLKAFRNYKQTFQHPRRFITNEHIDVQNDGMATGYAAWFVVQAHAGDSYYGWGTYDWDFRLEDDLWKMSKMIITVECMTTLERGWGALEERIAAFPSRPTL